jgi:DNA polymerase elongation subunit (family B)
MWDYTDTDEGIVIDIFGFQQDNSTILVRVNDFTPYFYLEIPDQVIWTIEKINRLRAFINESMGRSRPIRTEYKEKKRLYFAHKVALTEGGRTVYKDRLFPFLRIICRRFKDRYILRKIFNSPVYISGIGRYKYKIHECAIKPELQLGAVRSLPMAGWMSAKGVFADEIEKTSVCDHELVDVSYRSLKASNIDSVVRPLIFSWDIETYSYIPESKRRKQMKRPFPKASNPQDVVYQIGAVVGREGDVPRRYLLNLGVCGDIDDVDVRRFTSERDLLLGFRDLVQETNPDIFIGHNIFGFDIPYIIARSSLSINSCYPQMSQLSRFPQKKCERIEKSWSSSAYGVQRYEYIDITGRLTVDTLKLIERDYKLSSYSLNSVSSEFLGDDQKDPVTPEQIFEAYESQDPVEVARVGAYCVQDCVLPLKIFNKLQYWFGLCEMSTVTCVPIFYLYTKGQQIKVYSQVYRECYTKNFVVQEDVMSAVTGYQGASVREPIPGLYTNVVPFDFSSLYPTTIIAYNIDYSTFIDGANDIPDEHTHVFKWEDSESHPNFIDSHRYRFLKQEYAEGIIPSMLKNLLEARELTKNKMKKMKQLSNELKIRRDQGESIDEYKYTWACTQYGVLNKRQLALKVSANSTYGAMGVRRGYLPFSYGAMCTTARGRENIQRAADYLESTYNAKLVYGDTDSVYLTFPSLITHEHYEELWDFCLQVEDEMASLFPSPIRLEFEEKIYREFFSLSKKRYVGNIVDKHGNLLKLDTKGVVLTRRDNCDFLKRVYHDVLITILDRKTFDEVMSTVVDHLHQLLGWQVDYKEFIITKSIKDESEYKTKTLPSHVRLAKKMETRGMPVAPGSRIEYLFIDIKSFSANQGERVEDPQWYKAHVQDDDPDTRTRIDYLYYFEKQLVNPIDQLLSVAYGRDNVMKSIYNHHKLKRKCIWKIGR